MTYYPKASTMLPFILLSITNLPSFHSGGLWASHHRYPGYVMTTPGVHGQDCTPDSGDFPNACTSVGALLGATHGKIQCAHNFDCCICGTMLCQDCTDLVCNGDSSCYGVKDIELIGGELGAVINCNGDLSCMWTNIIGTNIGGILCTGDGACAYSIFDLDCTPDPEPCFLLCLGDDSCRSHETDPEKQAVFTLRNSAGMKCAHDACVDGTFNLMQNLGGSVICGAEESCVRAQISINNIGLLRCGGIMACKDAYIFIENPEEGFSVLCSGRSACENLDLEIFVTDPEIMDFRGVSCMSPSSCKGMHLYIHTLDPDHEIKVEELMCGAAEACRNMVIDVGPNILFSTCHCAGALTLACDNLLGVDECFAGMNVLECIKPNACKGMIETLTNPGNDFEVQCLETGSCQDMQLTIYMDGRRRGVNKFTGISCGATDACSGLKLNIYNVQGLYHRIDAGTVKCEVPNACNGTTVNSVGADVAVSCGDLTHCPNCLSRVEGHCTECVEPNAVCSPW